MSDYARVSGLAPGSVPVKKTKEGTTGIEPVTCGSAIQCSTAELNTRMNWEKAKGCGPLWHPLLIHEAYGTAIPSLTAAVDFACSVSGLGRSSTT